MRTLSTVHMRLKKTPKVIRQANNHISKASKRMKKTHLSWTLMVLLCGTIVAITLTARLSSARNVNDVSDVDSGVNYSLKHSAKQSNVGIKLNGTNATIPVTQLDNCTSARAQNGNYESVTTQPDNYTSIPKEPNEGDSTVLRWRIPEPEPFLTDP